MVIFHCYVSLPEGTLFLGKPKYIDQYRSHTPNSRQRYHAYPSVAALLHARRKLRFIVLRMSVVIKGQRLEPKLICGTLSCCFTGYSWFRSSALKLLCIPVPVSHQDNGRQPSPPYPWVCIVNCKLCWSSCIVHLIAIVKGLVCPDLGPGLLFKERMSGISGNAIPYIGCCLTCCLVSPARFRMCVLLSASPPRVGK